MKRTSGKWPATETCRLLVLLATNRITVSILAVALRESRVRKNPAWNAVCFHAQQCIEKYLKAVLSGTGKPFVKTHDLDALLNDCLDLFPLLEAMRADFKRLSRYAVQFRYPGESADADEARLAVKTVRRCRREIRAALGLSDCTRKNS